MAKPNDPDLNRPPHTRMNNPNVPKPEKLDRPGAVHRNVKNPNVKATPQNTFDQTDTGTKRSRWFNRDGGNRGNSPSNPQPKGSGSGPKTATGKPSGPTKPNLSPRAVGNPRFGAQPPRSPVNTTGVGKVRGGIGGVMAFATGQEAYDTLQRLPQARQDMNTYGALTPDSMRTNFNPINRAVDDVAAVATGGMAQPNLLERGVTAVKRMFSGNPNVEPFRMNNNSTERDLMLQYAAIQDLGEGASFSDLTPEMLDSYRARADKMMGDIESGTFDPTALSEADANLARNMGVNLDKVPVPSTTRTGIPAPTTATREPTLDQDYRTITGGQEPPTATPPFNEGGDQARLDYYAYVRDNMGQEAADQFAANTNTTPEEIAALDRTAPPITVGGNNATPPPTGNEAASEPNLFRRVGEDGVIEYSDQGGDGFEPLDMNLGRTNLKGGFVAAQDSIGDFPGTSAFVQSIGQEARARAKDFERQQRRARVNQARLPDRARAAVYRQNPDLVRTARAGGMAGGVASNALNEYTLRMAQIMQQGRDAFDPENIDTTAPVLEADRNDSTWAGVDADLQRTETYRQKNAIDAQGNLIDAQKNAADAMFDMMDYERELGERGAEEVGTYIERNFTTEMEDGTINPDIGRFDAFTRQLLTGRENPRQLNDKLRQAHFLTAVSPFVQDIAIKPDQLLSPNFVDDVINNKIPGITSQVAPTMWQRILNPVDTTTAEFSSSELDKPLIKFKGNDYMTLGQYLDLAQGYGKTRSSTVNLARNYAEK